MRNHECRARQEAQESLRQLRDQIALIRIAIKETRQRINISRELLALSSPREWQTWKNNTEAISQETRADLQ
jgi:hypothetical protein